MKLLLAGDPSAARAIETLGLDLEFADVDPDESVQLAACAVLAESIQKLLAELNESPTAAIRQRLTVAIGRELSEVEAASLLAGLSIDTLRPAMQSWLSQAAASKPAASASDAAPGAWFRDDATWSIRYRPAGHADGVLTSWLSTLAMALELDDRPVAREALAELTRPTAPGLCASCHSVDRMPTEPAAIHWFAADRSSAPKAFTKFNHAPHLLLPELADCTACHSVNASSDTSQSYAGFDPHAFTSDFHPMEKQHCATCHTTTAAGDRCQMCHNYHVGGGLSELPTILRPRARQVIGPIQPAVHEVEPQ
jgi:hypothetical protein